MRERGHALQPVSLLVTLVRSVPEAYDLAHRWKLSNAEKRLGAFVAEHRAVAYSPDTPLKLFQDLLVDGAPQTSVLELLHYCDRGDLAAQLRRWPVPRLPVNGRDLKGVGVPAGRALGRLLEELGRAWKSSHFTLTREELLDIARGSVQQT